MKGGRGAADFAVSYRVNKYTELKCKVMMGSEVQEEFRKFKYSGPLSSDHDTITGRSCPGEEGNWNLGESYERQKCDHECRERKD